MLANKTCQMATGMSTTTSAISTPNTVVTTPNNTITNTSNVPNTLTSNNSSSSSNNSFVGTNNDSSSIPTTNITATTTTTITNDNSTTPMLIATTPTASPAPAPALTSTATTTNQQQTDNVGPMTKPRPKPRPVPYAKSILLTADRRQRKKKTITWQPDDQMTKVHYFELIADERVNVSKQAQLDPANAANASFQQAAAIAAPSPNAHANRLNPLGGGGSRLSPADADPLSRQRINNLASAANNRSALDSIDMTYREWKAIPIDFNPELPSPGWNSVERSAQAEREMYVLGAIDLPGQPSTIDEPEGHSGGGGGGGGGGEDDASSVKIIPLDNPEGMYTEYPDINSIQMDCWPGISAGGASFQAWAPQLDDLARLNVL